MNNSGIYFRIVAIIADTKTNAFYVLTSDGGYEVYTFGDSLPTMVREFLRKSIDNGRKMDMTGVIYYE